MIRRERRAFFQYRLLARFAEILPVRGIRAIGWLAGVLGPRLNPSQALVVKRNLARVLEREPTETEVRHTYSSYVRYWLHAFRLPTVEHEYLNKHFQVDGFENLENALGQGRGAIIALPHLGNWDAAGTWFSSKGVPLTVVVERLQPPELHQWFEDYRKSLGMSVVINGPDVVSKLTSALKRNEVIALLSDRDVDGTGSSYEFFGETTTLPRGPAMLALRTGAALIPAAVYERGNDFVAVLNDPIDAKRSEASLREDIDRISQELIRELEKLIRREPTQWHVFQPNWPSDTRA